MSGFPSKNKAQRLPGGCSGDKRNGRESATNTSPALNTSQTLGGPVMPDYAGTVSRRDSTSNSQQQSPTGNFQSIGALAARLKEKCEQAIRDGNFEVAETYHQQLIDVEVGK